jgi:16S rRNA (guanine527-N7)-methyltransferase
MRLAASLAAAQSLGFIGPRAIVDHMAQAETIAVLAAMSRPSLLVDLGTGGGVPGLLLAVDLPDCEIILVEAMQKRATFLEMQLRSLGVEARTKVVQSPAEDAAYEVAWRHTADIVTARGFGPPAMTAEIAAGFLRPGGRLIVTVVAALVATTWPADALGALGYRSVLLHDGVWPLLECVMGDNGSLAARPDGLPLPRRRGLPRHRPLW